MASCPNLGALEAINNNLQQDPACLADLQRNQASGFVFGSGPVPADLVLIGEAPGRQEAAQKQPFVGRAGNLLDNLLGQVGLNKNQIYVTNVVKYRPLDNKTPDPIEIDNQLNYLKAELRIVRPRLIGCLGRVASSVFNHQIVISKDHGRLRTESLKGQNYRIIPCYHPAAGLYRKNYKLRLLDDLFQLKTAYLAETSPQANQPQ